jgi:leucyl-tRNA synthetase
MAAGSLDMYDTRAAVDVVESFEAEHPGRRRYTERGLLVNSGDFDGMEYDQVFEALATRFEAEGHGVRRVNFRLRDWGVSRPALLGLPDPGHLLPDCDAVPVPEDQLPVILPEDVAFSGRAIADQGRPEWRRTTCPQCGGPAERETDTFDTFMESSWYYARYTSPVRHDMVDARANTGRRSTSTSAASNTRSCTCCISASITSSCATRPGAQRRTGDEPVVPGHGDRRDVFRDNADGTKHWINPPTCGASATSAAASSART